MPRATVFLTALCLLLGHQAASAGESAPAWRYTTERPDAGWMAPGFDDSAWKQGLPGFGAGNVHGSPKRTAWTTSDIWIRGHVELPAPLPRELCLRMHHDEDAEVYVNGVLAARVAGHTTGYERFAISPAARKALRPGRNLVAAHCRQTRGGQFIDIHIVEGRPVKQPGRKRPTQSRGPAADLRTRWAKDVTPENAWAEYPRPQLVRSDWLNLNGLWDYAIEGDSKPWTGGRVENAKDDPIETLERTRPASWDGKILVPFCVESALSGVGKIVRPNQLLWYRRTFAVPDGWAGRRVLLHFEAADWHARVWVNGIHVGDHKGGYDPFSFDVTDALAARKGGKPELVVCVWDPTNMGDQPVGKQSLPEHRRGYRYTPTTGIWQTVWLEPVGRWHIEDLKLTPDVDGARLIVELGLKHLSRSSVADVVVLDSDREVARASGRNRIEVPIAKPRLWSPDDPFLYTVRVVLRRFNDPTQVDDEVTSYVGMRKVSLGKDANGFTRILLNGKPLFQFGPLDQGYWPDGILAPASDAAAAYDVAYLKRIGCNMDRVHVKVHPRRWYYHCDRLGLLVWQDMVCTRKFDAKITEASAAQFELELKRMIDSHRSHPSIVMWVVFNEGWGQYDTERLTKWVKEYDPTRLANNASGWADRGVGDVLDIHDYSFHPTAPARGEEPGRAVVLGECGGFDVLTEGHVWYPNQTQPVRVDPLGDGGREKYPDAAAWARRYGHWIEGLRLLEAHGLSGAVYTQISDVEHEPNGWLTYDRAVSKIDPDTLARWHAPLYGPPPKTRPIVPASHPEPWRYAAGKTPEGWAAADFDDSAWKQGQAPFGEGGTTWDGRTLHLRTAFELERVADRLAVRFRGLGAIDVHLNGRHVKSVSNRQGTRGRPFACVCDVLLPQKPADVLRRGRNVLAVRYRPAAGPKALDIALLEVLDTQ